MNAKYLFKAEIPHRSRFCFAPDPFEPSVPVFGEILTPDSAALIVTDKKKDFQPYFAAQKERGNIRDFRILYFSEDEPHDRWQLCLTLIQAGIDLQLRRSDAYIVYASTELTTLTTLVAAIYRRGIQLVKIQDNIESVFNGLREQDTLQACWHGYHSGLKTKMTIGLTHLNTLHLIDENSFRRSLPLVFTDRNIESLKLALTNDPYLFRENMNGGRGSLPSSEVVQYSVELVSSILDPANSYLSDCFPNGQRILAVVDAYGGHQAISLQIYLEHQLAIGKITGYEICLTDFPSDRKNMDAVLEILDRATEMALTSQDSILVMGGGTLMDIVGFAAALYQGGIPYIRIPTTLVGLIDAGIGLKVGVNFADKKNFLGTYYPSSRCLSRISHKKNEYETQKPYRVWVLTGYSSWRKNDSV